MKTDQRIMDSVQQNIDVVAYSLKDDIESIGTDLYKVKLSIFKDLYW